MKGCEIHKDKVRPEGRIYLNDYDPLEKYLRETPWVETGAVAPEVEALREEYLDRGLPRHPGKGVSRRTGSEVEAVVIDGLWGVAYTLRGRKLSKFLTITPPADAGDPFVAAPNAGSVSRFELFLNFPAAGSGWF